MTRSDDDCFEQEKLHYAARNGNLAEVKRLVAEGQDLGLFDRDLSFTPLHYAASERHLEIARYLLEHGADANAREEEKIGDTPLGAVAATCSYEMAELLIGFGANPTIPGWMGLSALHRAEQRKSDTGIRVYALLLQAAREKFNFEL